jgi:predicted DsbA family dithiol-disulfide isomerase
MEVAVAIASGAGGIDPAALRKKSESPELEARLKASTAEFTGMQVNQRPTFLLEDKIGDRVVISGLATAAPLAAAIEAMLADEAGYASYATHFGGPPTE